MSYDSVVTGLSPLARWKLNDTVGSTTVADATGHGWTATLISGTPTFGLADCPPAMSITTMRSVGAVFHTASPVTTAVVSATLVVWVKQLSTDGATSGFVLANGQSNGYVLGIGGSRINNFGNSIESIYGNVAFLDTTTPIGYDSWHMLGLTVDASGHPTVSLDGTSVLTTNNTPITPDVTTQVGGSVTCLMAEAAVFGSALGISTLRSLYAAGRYPPPAATRRWNPDRAFRRQVPLVRAVR